MHLIVLCQCEHHWTLNGTIMLFIMFFHWYFLKPKRTELLWRNEVLEATTSHVNDISATRELRHLQKIWSVLDDWLQYYQARSEKSWGLVVWVWLCLSRYWSKLNSSLKVSLSLAIRNPQHCWLEHQTRQEAYGRPVSQTGDKYFDTWFSEVSRYTSMLSISIQHGTKIASAVGVPSSIRTVLVPLHVDWSVQWGLGGLIQTQQHTDDVLFPGPG